MSVKIRLKRIGRRNHPFYRVCVFDARTRRDGAPIEELGSYDPHAESFEQKLNLKAERAAHWLSVGAQPSETVASLLKRAGVTRQGVAAPAAAAAPAPAAGAPATEDGSPAA